MTARGKRVVIRVPIALILLVAALVAYCAIWRSLPRALPAPTGRFGVGRVFYHWTPVLDEAYPHTGRAGPRDRAEVWIWYPTEVGAPGMPSSYAAASLLRLGRSDTAIPALFTQNEQVVRVHSIDDAPLAPDRAEYPVVLLTGGRDLPACLYTTMAEQFASRGWIVAGLVFQSESADRGSLPAKNRVRRTLPEQTPIVPTERLAADIIFVLDMLRAMNITSDGMFSSRMDLNRIALLGAGIGGAASVLAAAHLQPTVPVVVFGSGRADPDLSTHPVLVLQAGTAGQTGEAPPDSGDGPDTGTYRILGSTQLDFTDLPYLFDPVARIESKFGSMSPDRMRVIVYDMVETFVESVWMDEMPPPGAARVPFATGEPTGSQDPGRAALGAVAEAARQYPEVTR